MAWLFWCGTISVMACVNLFIVPAHPAAQGISVSRSIDSAAWDLAARFLESGCRAGFSVAIVADGRERIFSYGVASRATNEKPTANSVYEIGSVTKTFTGALAAQAVSNGEIGLDEDFRTYLPRAYPNLMRDGVPITLRSLATHRSGLPRDLPDSAAIFAHRDFRTIAKALLALDRGYDRDRYLSDLHEVALAATPGSLEAYSNIGMKVIGFGLETVHRAPFETLIQRSILQPLGLIDTGFELSARQRARLVTGYDRFGRRTPYHLRNAGAAYGLYSTPADMARYVRWQLDETIPEIALAHRILSGDANAGSAMIWNVGRDHGERILWHGGGTFGMSSQVVLYPNTRDGYALLANDSCDGTEEALKGVAQRLHRERFLPSVEGKGSD